MSRCVNYEKCPFLKKYEPGLEKSEALKKKILLYCEGELQDECVRKKISKTLGGPDYVPINMMPDGKPVLGTSMNEWSAEVLGLYEKYK